MTLQRRGMNPEPLPYNGKGFFILNVGEQASYLRPFSNCTICALGSFSRGQEPGQTELTFTFDSRNSFANCTVTGWGLLGAFVTQIAGNRGGQTSLMALLRGSGPRC